MKKFLMVSGVVFWVLIVIGAVFFGCAHYRGSQLDASSKAYVDKNIPVIISTWSEQEMLKYASHEFKAVVSNNQSKFDQTWTGFEKLGALKKYNGSKGQSYQNAFFLVGRNGKKGYETTAEYVAGAEFQNGNVEISIDLTRENDEWKIYGFHVNSPSSQIN
jgi:heme/copper-type cytochrome/quinol oxidase subunit 2